MQIAINVLLFFLGFGAAIAVATGPKKSRDDLVKFVNNLRFVTNGLQSPSTSADLEKRPASNKEIVETESQSSKLLAKDDVECQYDMSSWQRLAYEEFKSTILARGSNMKTFPCIYATMGFRSDQHRYIFLPNSDPSSPANIRHLAPLLLSYIRLSPKLGPNTSLVILCAPSSQQKSVEGYNNEFWAMLRSLRTWDPKPYPPDIPSDTDSPHWTFCFDSQPLFPVLLTPSHERRWSRHSPVPLIALQPKFVLDELLSTPEKRASATGKVRKLLEKYDNVGVSPDLTGYGEEGTSEVRQLCLMDENERAVCPYRDFDQ